MRRIIDGDGHIVEPPDLWLNYAHSSYHDQVPTIAHNADGIPTVKLEGKTREGVARSLYSACVPAGLVDAARMRELDFDAVPKGGWEPDARIEVMDAEGIECAFLYPSMALGLGHLTNLPLAAECARAYNNWLADFCAPHPSRLFGIGMVALQDVEGAIAEMRRVVRDKGMKCVFFRPNPYNARRLNDPAYEPFWAAAEELDCAIAIHGSFGSRMPPVCDDR